jgi:glycosyltransferase involved in cell wall biosynthesis
MNNEKDQPFAPVYQSRASNTAVEPKGQISPMLVSVIIPAFNEEKNIGNCLKSLLCQDFPRDSFEVILVDNGSADRTAEIALSFASSLHLIILREENVRISGLRNLGASKACGEILVFMDADCAVPAPNWLQDVIALFQNGGQGVLGAFYRVPDNYSWVAHIWSRYQEETKRGNVSHVPAGNLLMRRSNFLQVGGFNELIQTNEDYELCKRVREAGLSVLADPALSVLHFGTPQTLAAFYRQQRWHGTDVARVYFRSSIADRNARAVLFALYTLCCEIGIGGGILWGILAGYWRLLGISCVAIWLPPVALSLRRILAQKRWRDFFPLSLLYLIYGLARANCLWNPARRKANRKK